MAREHHVRLACVAGPCNPALAAAPRTCHLANSFGPIFVVLSVGETGVGAPADDGVTSTLTLDVVSAIRAAWPPCVDRRRNHHVLTAEQMKQNAAGKNRA